MKINFPYANSPEIDVSDVVGLKDDSIQLHAVTAGWINMSVGGFRGSVVGDRYAWLSLRRADIDDLITVLEYYKKYGTFKRKEDQP